MNPIHDMKVAGIAWRPGVYVIELLEDAMPLYLEELLEGGCSDRKANEISRSLRLFKSWLGGVLDNPHLRVAHLDRETVQLCRKDWEGLCEAAEHATTSACMCGDSRKLLKVIRNTQTI